MVLRRTIALGAGLVFAAAMLISSLPLRAQTQEAGNGLQMSPTRTEITGQKGEEKSFSIQLKNISNANIKLVGVLNDFTSDGESGSPQIITDTEVRTPNSLSGMLKGLKDIDLKAGESKELDFTLQIPTNAVSGAYYGAIRYQVVPNNQDDSGKQVALNASVAHLVFLEVPGEINEQIKIDGITVRKNDKDEKGGTFFMQSPTKATIRISNLGNGFSRPFGTVYLKYFGKESYTYDFNKQISPGIILPNSSRNFTDDIKNISRPGKYSVHAAIAYGNGSEVVEYESSFWYLPLWILLIPLILIIVLAVAAYTIYRRKFARKQRRY